MSSQPFVSQREYPLDEQTTLMSTSDLNSYVTHVNDAFIQVSGYSLEEISGQPHNLVRHPDMPKAAFADMWYTLKQGEPWSAIVKNRRKNGDHYWEEPTLFQWCGRAKSPAICQFVPRRRRKK